MKKWFRRISRLLGFLVVVGAVAGVIWRADVIRLYHFITLYDEGEIVSNFSSMRDRFPYVDIKRGDVPVFVYDEAPVPLPEQFESPDGILNTAEFLADRTTTSLLVIRDDAIEFEEYYLGTGEEDLRISWSIAKSALSMLIGIALADGDIESLDDPVTKYAPMLVGSAYDGASIRNVLNMSSGVAFDEDYLAFNSDINKMSRVLALGGSLDEYTASLTKRASAPGENWRYVSIDTHVIGMVLRGATGQPVPQYFQDKIWSRIGVEADAYYMADTTGQALVLGGLNIRTRDYARLGRLILNGGVWNGERVLPAGWVRESTTASAPPPVNPADKHGYGYQWWLPPDADQEVFGIGIYGQYLWIDRKARVVIVKTSGDRKFRENNEQSERDSYAFFRAVARR